MTIVLSAPLIYTQGFAASCDSKTVARIDHALKSGKKVLVLSWSVTDKCGDEDEACGDWADRLNTFAAGQGKSLEIVKLSPSKWKQAIELGSKESPPLQSTLFLMKDRPAYFHKGPILEAEVYQAVLESWTGKHSEQTKNFLPKQTAVKFCK